MTTISKIDRDTYQTLMSSDLSEVCELHARGHLTEVVAISADIQGNYANAASFVIAHGKIDGEEYAHDDLHNVSCIGGRWTFHADTAYYHVSGEVSAALDLALTLFKQLDHVDSV